MSEGAASGPGSAHHEKWEEERAANPRWWWATLIGPPLSFVVLLVVVAIAFDLKVARGVLLRALMSFFVVGRVAILEPTDVMTAEALLALVIYMDVAAAFFVAPHVGFLFQVPWLGRRLSVLVEDSEAVLARAEGKKWLTYLGLVGFVFIPVTATGSVGGAVLGRLLGLTRTLTISAVLVGSALCSGLIYSGSAWVRSVVSPDAVGPKIVAVAIVVVLFWVLNQRYRAALRRVRARQAKRDAARQEAP